MIAYGALSSGRSRVELSTPRRAFDRRHEDRPEHGGLDLLGQLVESLGVGQLARVLGVSLSTASELVGDLSRAGIVERGEDPADRRRTIVALAQRHRAHASGSWRAGPRR